MKPPAPHLQPSGEMPMTSSSSMRGTAHAGALPHGASGRWARRPSLWRGVGPWFVASLVTALVTFVLLWAWGPSASGSLQFSPSMETAVLVVFGVAMAMVPVTLLLMVHQARRYTGTLDRRVFLVLGAVLLLAWEGLLSLVVLGAFAFRNHCEPRTLGGVEYYECNVGFLDPRYFYYEVEGPFMMSGDGIDGGEYPVSDGADPFAPEADD